MELLEKYFDTAFDAPDGIKKLRELILTVAMQGKLVPQDTHDQSASELLKEIEAEKKLLVKEGKIKEPKPLTEIKPEEVPYELPKGWEWSRLDKLAPMSITDGDWIESKDQDPDGEIRLIQLADIGVNEFKDVSERFINSDTFDRLKCSELLQGDILIARLPNPIGRACIFPGLPQRAITAVDVAILRPLNFFDTRYVVHAINSPSFRMQVELYGKGSTRFRIATGNLKTILVPLPPLAEQRRIVAKIDQLMARCDGLEKLRAEHGQKRIAAHNAAINRLLTTTESGIFASTWQFISQNFGEFYSVKENVAELRKSILQLAVMGKLVPQNANDQPASELLKEVKTEKQRLVKDEILRTEANEQIEKNEEYLGRPYGWEYCRLGNLARFIDYRGKTPKKVDSGVPLITAKNVRFGYINREPYEYVTEDEYISWMTRGFPKTGDLLFTTEAPLGNIAIIDIQGRFALAQRVICLQLHKSDMAFFLKWLIMSGAFQTQLLNNATGMTATGIKASRLKEIPIPIPPLAEQHRIVAKIDRLMALCDEIDKQLDDATSKQTALLNAIMVQV